MSAAESPTSPVLQLSAELRRSFAHRALLWLMLTGALGTAIATTVHYNQAHPALIDLIIPPSLCVIFLGLAVYLWQRPEQWRRVVWVNFSTGLIGIVIPAWYFPLLAVNRSVRLIDVLPPMSSMLIPLLLMLVVFVKPRQVLIAASASWALVAVPILGYLLLHPAELTSPRGHDLILTLGPVLMIVVVYIVFQRNIEREMGALREREAELSRLAERDALTGLFNRRAGESYLLELRAGIDRNVGLILFDLDHFKRINDQHGHPAGDAVLREVAERCAARLRSADVLARWGGEEFLVLASVSHLDEAMRIAEHLRAAVADLPIVPVGTVSASFGVTLLAANETQEQALERADRALYAAKNQGRNRVIAG